LNETDLSLDGMSVRRSEGSGRTNTSGQMQNGPYPALPVHNIGKKGR
jgi:hypothetical protein